MQPQRQLPGSASNIRTLAVDDHRVFREALIEMVAATRGFVLVGQATTGEEAVRAVDRFCPQLVLMDVCMPGMDGIEAAGAIVNRHPGIMVVLISVNDPWLFPGAASLGDAVCCICKQDLGPRRLRQLWDTHGS
jgi:DNA-binding NarL/FixJ family response regulator